MLIFIIDDEPLILRGSKQVVARAVPDADLKAFESGDDALEYMETTKEYPDTVFCDIEMPGGTGQELVEWIRGRNMMMGVIMVTCHPEFSYMRKPYTKQCYRACN